MICSPRQGTFELLTVAKDVLPTRGSIVSRS